MKKKYEKIAEEHLAFALNYGYSFQYKWKSPYRKISLIKNDTIIEFVELPQFFEKYLYVYLGESANQIDISKFQSKSIKSSEEYWRLISKALKYYLDNNIDLMKISVL